ncbi:hypothetical protein DMENIID0001_131800 [Sergentomyia squamirostris]
MNACTKERELESENKTKTPSMLSKIHSYEIESGEVFVVRKIYTSIPGICRCVWAKLRGKIMALRVAYSMVDEEYVGGGNMQFSDVILRD